MNNRVLALVTLLFVLITSQLFATEVIGSSLGNGNDSDPATFHLDPDNVDFQLYKSDGTVMTAAEVPIVYGSSVKVFADNVDYIASSNLQVVGANLSGSNWTNRYFPALGQVAIDPETGRVKFARTWSPNQDISINTGYGIEKQPEVTLNNNGVGFLTYYYYETSTLHRVAVHQYENNQWQPGINISSSDYSAFEPVIDMSDNNQAFCTFYQSDGSYNNIFVSQYSPNGTWAEPISVSSANTGNAYVPRIDVNKIGTAIVGWYQRLATGSLETGMANISLNGSGWEGETDIDYAFNDVDAVTVKVNDHNFAISAVLQEYGTTTNNVIYTSYFDGSSWSSPTLISSFASSSYVPVLAISNTGNAVCVFKSFADGRLKARIFNGSTRVWGPTENIDANGSNPFDDINVAMDDNGHAICAFLQNDGTKYHLYANRYVYGSGWQGAVQIDNQNNLGLDGMSLAVSGNGNAAVGFTEDDLTSLRVYVTRYVNGSWQSPDLVEGDAGAYGSVRVAINDDNTILCAYRYRYPSETIERAFVSEYRSEIPTGTMVANYYRTYEMTPTPLPTKNDIVVTGRKIQPLKGEVTTMRLDMTEAGHASVKVYTLQGKLVKTLLDEYQTAGSHVITWNGQNSINTYVASGIYLVIIKTPGMTEKIKIAVLK